MTSKKVLTYLGFAAKKRSLAVGYNTTEATVKNKKIFLVVIARDISENSKEKIVKLCEKNNLDFEIYGTMEELSKATGNVEAGIFSVTDANLSKAIKTEIRTIS